MENEHFEELAMQYLNGNKSWFSDEYQENMTDTEKEDFLSWLTTPELSTLLADHDRISIMKSLLIRQI